MTANVTFDDILRANERIRPYLQSTPLETAPTLGAQVALKLENLNLTHSFKVRGALNAILSLDEETKAQGIIAASSGNHAQGVAYAAHVTGTPARIVMPTHTPRRKVDGVRRWGAEAVLFGATYDEAEAEGRRLESTEKRPFVSPYNDPHVIAGAGTVGLEIALEMPTVERVLVPVSGGGLISGVALAIKTLRPTAEVIGVCAESAPAMYNTFYDTTLPQVWDTLAEALSGEIENGSITIDLARRYVDRVVLVSESEIRAAMRWAVDALGLLIEGGGAVGIAALRSGVVTPDERPTAVVISGGNLDLETVQRVLCEC